MVSCHGCNRRVNTWFFINKQINNSTWSSPVSHTGTLIIIIIKRAVVQMCRRVQMFFCLVLIHHMLFPSHDSIFCVFLVLLWNRELHFETSAVFSMLFWHLFRLPGWFYFADVLEILSRSRQFSFTVPAEVETKSYKTGCNFHFPGRVQVKYWFYYPGCV